MEIHYTNLTGNIRFFDGAAPDDGNLVFCTNGTISGQSKIISKFGRLLLTGRVDNGSVHISLKEIHDKIIRLQPEEKYKLYNPFYPTTKILYKYFVAKWSIVAPQGYHILGKFDRKVFHI